MRFIYAHPTQHIVFYASIARWIKFHFVNFFLCSPIAKSFVRHFAIKNLTIELLILGCYRYTICAITTSNKWLIDTFSIFYLVPRTIKSCIFRFAVKKAIIQNLMHSRFLNIFTHYFIASSIIALTSSYLS